MGTDRDASGEGAQPRPGPAAPHSPSAQSPPPAPTEDHARDYDYGAEPLPAAGEDGPQPADSGTEDPAKDPQATPQSDPGTGMRTAPRAVLRPVPEGFPTPPPRPARPNRRPAPAPEPAQVRSRHRGLLITGIAVAAALLLAIVLGGGVLAYRALSPAEPAASGAPVTEEDPASADTAGPGRVEIAGGTLTEVSTETGVRRVGGQNDALEPEGEFVIVVFEVANDSDAPVMVDSSISLETAEGEEHLPHSEAGLVHVASSLPYGVVSPGTTEVFHKVYDVPIGTDPTGLTVRFSALDEIGTLPVDA